MDSDQKTFSAAERQLLKALSQLGESVAYCASGVCPLVLPGLTVEGIGEVSLTVPKTHARCRSINGALVSSSRHCALAEISPL